MERKLTIKQKIKIATEVMARAVEISETTKAQVFVEYCPHVDWISWHYYERGTKNSEMSEIHNISLDVNYGDPRANLKEFHRAMDELEAAE